MPFIECINSAVPASEEEGGRFNKPFGCARSMMCVCVCVCVSMFMICHPERYFSVFLMQIFTKLEFFCMPAAITYYRRQYFFCHIAVL